MAVKVDVHYSGTAQSLRDPKTTFAYCADLETALTRHFPGLERFAKVADQTYHWIFETIKYGGYEFQIKVATRFQLHPDRSITMVSVPEPGFSTLKGEWTFTPQGNGTQISFTVVMQTELPLPSLVRAMAAPIAQKELSKVFERYLADVGKALSK